MPICSRFVPRRTFAAEQTCPRQGVPPKRPSAIERTPVPRSEMTRSPVTSAVSRCFDTSRDVARYMAWFGYPHRGAGA